jgi:hypothetical protein
MVRKWAWIAPLVVIVLGCGGATPGDSDDDGRADREPDPPKTPFFKLLGELSTALAGTPGLVEDAHLLYEQYKLPPARIERNGQLVQERTGDESAPSRSLVTYSAGLVQTIEVGRCDDVISACADGESLAVVGNFVARPGSTELAPVVKKALDQMHLHGSPLLDVKDYLEKYSPLPGWVSRTGVEIRLLDQTMGLIVQRLSYPGGDSRRPMLVTYVPEREEQITPEIKQLDPALIETIRVDDSGKIVNQLQIGSTTKLK